MLKYMSIILLGTTCLLSAPASAEDWSREISQLRQDVQILQRQVYRGTEGATAAAQPASDWEQTARRLNDRLDALENEVKQMSSQLATLKNAPSTATKPQAAPAASKPAPAAPKATTTSSASSSGGTVDISHQDGGYVIAENGAKSVVGDSISSGDLAPIEGTEVADSSASSADISSSSSAPRADTAVSASTTEDLPRQATSAEDLYAAAMQEYNAGNYAAAENGFNRILQQHPKHILAGNSQYWLGEVYAKQGNLSKATLAFKNGYQNYKNGNKAADSLYRLGMVLKSQKQNQNACIVFNSFAAEFPKANAELKKKVDAEAKKLGC